VGVGSILVAFCMVFRIPLGVEQGSFQKNVRLSVKSN
jgi:hypothetical protein